MFLIEPQHKILELSEQQWKGYITSAFCPEEILLEKPEEIDHSQI